jgi:hypothetical protein
MAGPKRGGQRGKVSKSLRGGSTRKKRFPSNEKGVAAYQEKLRKRAARKLKKKTK